MSYPLRSLINHQTNCIFSFPDFPGRESPKSDKVFIRSNAIIIYRRDIFLCIIIGDLHQFNVHCFISLINHHNWPIVISVSPISVWRLACSPEQTHPAAQHRCQTVGHRSILILAAIQVMIVFCQIRKGHWAVNYTSPQSLIINVFLFVGLTILIGWLFNLSVQINFNLQNM